MVAARRPRAYWFLRYVQKGQTGPARAPRRRDPHRTSRAAAPCTWAMAHHHSEPPRRDRMAAQPPIVEISR